MCHIKMISANIILKKKDGKTPRCHGSLFPSLLFRESLKMKRKLGWGIIEYYTSRGHIHYAESTACCKTITDKFFADKYLQWTPMLIKCAQIRASLPHFFFTRIYEMPQSLMIKRKIPLLSHDFAHFCHFWMIFTRFTDFLMTCKNIRFFKVFHDHWTPCNGTCPTVN